MSKRSSHGEILRATSIIGGASVVNIALGLLRMKAAALLLGPVGVGLLGFFQTLIATGATFASLGLGTAGTKQIAAADDPPAQDRARRALFSATIGLAIIGGLVFWLLREVIARNLFDDAALADELGWLAIGVALLVVSGSQSALLTGLRRIGDVARVTVIGATLGTAAALPAIFLLGENGIVPFVLALPVATLLVGWYFVSRVPSPQGPAPRLHSLAEEWRSLFSIGLAFTLAALAGPVAQLAVRALVQRELGGVELGYFQASAAISTTYLAFVLQAMGTDFFPRLSAAIRHHADANRIVNDQIEVGLILAGPVLLVVLGGAPWLIQLLYSASFASAASILQWQMLGDVLKVVSWPMAFILLASGASKRFVLAETSATLVFVVATALLLPMVGIEGAGMAYAAMYLSYVPLLLLLTRRLTGFSWERRVATAFLALVLAAVVSFAASRYSAPLGALVAAVAAAGIGVAGLVRLRRSGVELPLVGRLLRRRDPAKGE